MDCLQQHKVEHRLLESSNTIEPLVVFCACYSIPQVHLPLSVPFQGIVVKCRKYRYVTGNTYIDASGKSIQHIVKKFGTLAFPQLIVDQYGSF